MKSGTLTLEDCINKKIEEVAAVADEMPGVVIVHTTVDFSILYMSQRGLDILGTTLAELRAMGPQYHSRYFNTEQTLKQIPKLTAMLQSQNDSEIVSLFQEVRRLPDHPWSLHCSSMKVLLRDENAAPVLTISLSIPIDPEHHLAGNVNQLLDELEFFKQNSPLFGSLTRREKLVLAHLALGKTSAAIGKEIHLSPLTVDTHRRNIKEKLGIRTPQEFWQFAKVFGLL